MHDPGSREHRFFPRVRNPRRSDIRLRALATEQLCHAFPTGAVALDAHCDILFSNREGAELLLRWNSGRTKDSYKTHSKRPSIPPEVVAACYVLRGKGGNAGASRMRPKFGGRIFVPHPRNPNLNAVVALERS